MVSGVSVAVTSPARTSSGRSTSAAASAATRSASSTGEPRRYRGAFDRDLERQPSGCGIRQGRDDVGAVEPTTAPPLDGDDAVAIDANRGLDRTLTRALVEVERGEIRRGLVDVDGDRRSLWREEALRPMPDTRAGLPVRPTSSAFSTVTARRTFSPTFSAATSNPPPGACTDKEAPSSAAATRATAGRQLGPVKPTDRDARHLGVAHDLARVHLQSTIHADDHREDDNTGTGQCPQEQPADSDPDLDRARDASSGSRSI